MSNLLSYDSGVGRWLKLGGGGDHALEICEVVHGKGATIKGGSGWILRKKILKSGTSETRFPAF